MSTSTDLKELPAQARRRIEKLETTVSELAGALCLVVDEMRRHGHLIDVKSSASSAVAKRVFKKSRAGRSMTYAQTKLARKAPRGGAAVPAAAARGEAARLEWVRSGEVVPARELADAWALTPQALGPIARRGHVFEVVIKGQRYYPKEFLVLERDDVAAVCKQLEPLSASEKLVFWKQHHGALGGRTVAELLSNHNDRSQLPRVAQLANSRAAQARAAAQA